MNDPVLLYPILAACMPLLLYEELVLNTLATLNNLSYYPEPDSYVVQRQQEVTEREELISFPDLVPSHVGCSFPGRSYPRVAWE